MNITSVTKEWYEVKSANINLIRRILKFLSNNNYQFSWAYVIALILIITVSTYSQYQISPYEIIYEDLRYLQTSGLLTEINLSQIPVTDAELLEKITLYSGSGDSKKLSPHQSNLINKIGLSYNIRNNKSRDDKLLDKLMKRIPVLSLQKGSDANLTLGGNIDFQLRSQSDKTLYPSLHTFGMLILPAGISIVNIVKIDPNAADEPNYIGKEWRGFSAFNEQAYFQWISKYGRVVFGRNYIVNGPGRKGSLLFSSVCRPVDHLQVELVTKRLSFQSVIGKLDPIDNARRYISSHRLSLFLRKFQISVTEAVLYGGVNRTFELQFANPFIFFHGEQLNDASLGMSGNTFGTVDFRYFGNKWSLYGEILIDDIQLDNEEPGDLEPNEIGFLFGADVANPFGYDGLYVGCEYTALTNRTYKTPNPYEFHLHRNVPVGYPLGSDLDRLNIKVKKYIKSRWQVALEYDYIRRGEGEMNVPWDSPWMDYTVKQGYSEPFPTGVIEYTNSISAEIRWIPSYKRYIYLLLNYNSITNLDHIKNKNDDDLSLSLGIWIDLEGRIDL